MEDKEFYEIVELIDYMDDNAYIRETRWDGDMAIANSEKIVLELLKHYQIVDKNKIVISREEYERLGSSHNIVFCDNKDCPNNPICRCCEISECPENIPEYNEKLSANKYQLELFQKLYRERERANGWEDRYKLLEEELKQLRKEMAEKILNIIDIEIEKGIEHCKDDYRGLLTARVLIQLFCKEQFGTETKE